MNDGLFKKLKDALDSLSGKKIRVREETEEKQINKPKNIYNLIVIALVLVLIGISLPVINGFFNPTTAVNLTYEDGLNNEKVIVDDNEEMTVEEYEEKLGNKLKSILENIDGVGKVNVMIYCGSGEEHIPAINVNDSNSVTDETDNEGGTRRINQNNDGRTVVVLNEGDTTKALITKTYQPKITGVVIAAEGADDKFTKLRINQAVVNLFNLSTEKVNVYPMKK